MMSTNSYCSGGSAGMKSRQGYYKNVSNVQTNLRNGSLPFAKRQKMMTTREGIDDSDPFQDEDDDFTSDDFMAMDEMASQALTQIENSKHSKLSVNKKSQYENRQKNYTREYASTTPPHHTKVYYHPHSPRSHSSHSIPFEEKLRKQNPVQTNVSIPSTIQGGKYLFGSKSSTNVQNATDNYPSYSSEIPRGTTASLTPPADLSSKDAGMSEVSVVENHSTSHLQDFLNVSKEELEKTKSELKTLQNERFVKDGEIKVLRENLNKLNAELNKIRLEKIQKEQEAKTEKSEREKELQKQLEKLKTEIHFKDRELLEAQSFKCKSIEQRQQRVDGVTMSPVCNPTTPPRRSPKGLKGKSPSTPTTFPTRRSFMAQDGDTPVRKAAKIDTNTTVEENKNKTKGPSLPKTISLVCPSKKFSGNYSGPRLLRAVLEKPTSLSYSENCYLNNGLITLLNPGNSRDQYSIAKEGGASAWSERRINSKMEKNVNRGEMSKPFYSENVDLVLRTVLELLNSTTEGPVDVFNPPKTDDQLSFSTAIQLLPALEHHLTLYIEHLDKLLLQDSNILPSSSILTSSSSTGTRSLDRFFGQNSAFGCTEENVLSSLTVLQRLAGCCVDVTNGILAPQDMEGVPSSATTTATDMDVSAPLIDTMSGTCKSTVSVRNAPAVMNSGMMLRKLFRLLVVQQKHCQQNPVMEEALKVLIVLSRKCEKSLLSRFKPLLVEECLQNLLDLETTNTELVRLVLDLLTNLAANFELAKMFCNQKDSCLLLKLYECAVLGISNFSATQTTWMRSKIFVFLSSLVFVHPGGMRLVVEADCNCSSQLIRSVILTIDKEYRELISTQENYDQRLVFLRRGVMVLHTLSFNDNLFHEHRVDVEQYYVHLVSGLLKLLKQSEGIPEQEVCALEDLWDFDQSDDNDWDNEGDYEAQTDMELG
ncbi:ATR-interacting protein-like [Anneissia japonica]|uniref:ATR-interacting protein-like n=1 Tax=Anneissia japonica TaxID=1529436 RepID=UPI0014256760|nr:ATR-interacting protein-like [Anneissia japonica]XP_033114611.1 ATR-interacting protein-like [Anneissia japonica]XP_033114612.1 ATR-interacting protein-like [Anneissia japonica]